MREKVGVAEADTSFRKLVTANDRENHHRVSHVRELVSVFLAGRVGHLPWSRDDCYCKGVVNCGVMRNNRERKGSWWGSGFRFLSL